MLKECLKRKKVRSLVLMSTAKELLAFGSEERGLQLAR